jgi:hypothetical protein
VPRSPKKRQPPARKPRRPATAKADVAAAGPPGVPAPPWTPFGSITFWSRLIGVSRNTLSMHLRTGAVPCERLGKLVRVPVALLAGRHQAEYLPPP